MTFATRSSGGVGQGGVFQEPPFAETRLWIGERKAMRHQGQCGSCWACNATGALTDVPENRQTCCMEWTVPGRLLLVSRQ